MNRKWQVNLYGEDDTLIVSSSVTARDYRDAIDAARLGWVMLEAAGELRQPIADAIRLSATAFGEVP